jgi:hypothetical protein
MELAHSVGDKVEVAYRCGDLFEKRRRLMAQWAEFCSKPPAKVLELSKKRDAALREYKEFRSVALARTQFRKFAPFEGSMAEPIAEAAE